MSQSEQQAVWTLFQSTVTREPERLAIVEGERAITYSKLDQQVCRCALRLKAMGIERHSMLAACLGNNVEFVTLFLAVAALEATLVPVDDRLPTAEIRDILTDCEPDLCIFWRWQEDVAAAACGGLARSGGEGALTVTAFVEELMGEHELPASRPPRARAARERCGEGFLIQYTSGSTGAPKGLVHSQSSLAHTAAGWNQTVGVVANDRLLCILTLAHAHATDIHLLPALAAGATLHFMDLRRVTPRRVLSYIAEHEITVFSALPYTFELMLTLPEGFTPDLSNLRLCFCGSAPLSATLGERFARRFGIRLSNLYGMSELGPTHTNLFGEGDEDVDFGSVGRPLRGIRVKVVDSDGVEVRPGQVGEILMSSGTFALGYFKRSDLTAEVFGQDGWIRSQDMGYVDPRGRYFIVGRKSQFMNVGGNKVYPAEVEGVILELAGIRHAAVTGVDDPIFTERIIAFVVAEPTVTREAIIAHCRGRLADYKVPREIVAVDALPRNGIGKILKTELKALLDEYEGAITRPDSSVAPPKLPASELP